MMPLSDADDAARTVAVVGGQYGSEGKGAVVARIAGRFATHVRVGAANAGHTFYTSDGVKRTCQQLPCAAYAHPAATLVLGPGALISADILTDEIARNRRWRAARALPPADILLDFRAHIIQPQHIAREAAGDLGERIGSASARAREGIGEAQADRVLRSADSVPASCAEIPLPAEVTVCDTVRALRQRSAEGLLEGTQGAGLSLITGDYPYVTSRDTTASGLCADAGVPARQLDEVIMVCRTFPIRVAGASGPFWDGSQEISWKDIGVDPDLERTTVTGLIRRVATFSVDQVAYAAHLNGATQIALTFCDYLDRRLAGCDGHAADHRSGRVRRVVEEIEQATGVPVTYLGTGPRTGLTGTLAG